MAEKITSEERATLTDKAFSKLPGASEGDHPVAKQRFAGEKAAAQAAVAAIVDTGATIEFEPRDGFYCVRTERDGTVRRFVGASARLAAEKALVALS